MGILERMNPRHTLGAPPARVRDAVGRVLELGDEVVVVTPKQIMRVAEIRPMLEPGAPKDALMVTLVTRMIIVVPRDQGVEDLYFLRHQAEIGDQAIKTTPEGEDASTDRDHEEPPA